MPLEIAYTCNWCSLKLTVEAVGTPKDWINDIVHDPITLESTAGFFCKPLCKENYEKNEPAAIEEARKQYASTFWTMLNKAKQCDT